MHLLRYFSLILLIAIGTKFENALATYYAVGGSGQFVWSTSVYPFIYGICASGDDVACGSETNIHSASPNEVGFSKNAVSYVVSGYQVSTYVLMQCADSDFMCANCGSHSDKNCQYNGYAGISGIACCTPSYPIFMQKGTGVNYAPTTGHDTYCSAGYVASGHCSSGKGHDCGGSTNQLRCSKPIDCLPSKIYGSWVFIKAGSSEGEKVATVIGVSVTASVSKTITLHEGYTVEVSKGFSFMDSYGKSVDVTAEFSKTVSVMFSASASLNAIVATEAHCDFAPYVLYQFQMVVEGNCGEKFFIDAYVCTKSLASPPCCLPGYNLDTHGQICYPGSPNLCNNGTTIKTF